MVEFRAVPTLGDLIAANFIQTILACILFYLLYVSLSRWHEIQNGLLLLAGYLIYAYISWKHFIVLLCITVFTFLIGTRLSTSKPPIRSRLVFVGVGLLVGVLALFRYDEWLAQSISRLFVQGISLELIAPLGISFYTLQAVSYLVEIANNRLQPTKNLMHLALYLSFLFKLPAGPIEKPAPFLQQIGNSRTVTAEHWNVGLWLIILGLLEKKVMADNLAPIVNSVYGDPAAHAGLDIVVATVAFAFQIYGDFSGYSNIGRGLAKFFGFDLTLNFRLPYFATSPNDFWMRWHISLSNWLREYIFFPARRWLATKSFRGAVAVIVPTTLSMVASGLWHGAGVNFLIWGIYFAGLSIGYYYLDRFSNLRKGALASFVVACFRVGLMFVLVCLGWMIFRSTGLDHLGQLIANLGLATSGQTHGFIADIIFFAGPIVLINFIQALTQDLMVISRWPAWLKAPVYAFTLCWILIFSAPDGVEFIYSRF